MNPKATRRSASEEGGRLKPTWRLYSAPAYSRCYPRSVRPIPAHYPCPAPPDPHCVSTIPDPASLASTNFHPRFSCLPPPRRAVDRVIMPMEMMSAVHPCPLLSRAVPALRPLLIAGQNVQPLAAIGPLHPTTPGQPCPPVIPCSRCGEEGTHEIVLLHRGNRVRIHANRECQQTHTDGRIAQSEWLSCAAEGR